MQTRALPGTDLSVSIIGFGGWAMGRTYWGDDVDDADSIAAVRLALDLGVNWFDTAPLYGEGHADEVLARALGNERHRDDIIIATKVGVRIRGQHGHAQCDLSPGHIRADVDASLTRLGVERIDLLQVHWPCELGTPLEESFGALDALRRSGKVRHLGVCNYDAASLARIRDIAPIVSLQTPLSLLRREYEGELAPACARLGLGVLAYEPLCRGLLTGKYLRPHSFPASDMRSRDDRFSGSRFAHSIMPGAFAKGQTMLTRMPWCPHAASIDSLSSIAHTEIECTNT